MPRKKKTEEVKEVVKQEVKPVDYGTGWTGRNNRIQAGVKEEKNE